MKQTLILIGFFIIPAFCVQAYSPFQGFNKAAYYNLMENGKTDAVNQQLKIIESASNIDKDAYSGALLMKKAGLVKNPSQKLSLFKEGHSKLEAAIKKDNANAEWRLLRLIIQEHAPGILNYNDDIKNDAAFIHINFKKLSPEVQAAVLDYRKHSDTLQPLNF